MKTLPDNPHLDHLRQQAKDLLAGLRETDPALSLADAQGRLARQYGFRSWTELKAEVDRLRGSADTAPADLTLELAARFGLGRVTEPMRSLSRPDDVGRRWSLQTDRGRWSVRNLDGLMPIVDAETDCLLQEAVAAAGIRLPTPIRSTSGAVVESVGGHDWRVYDWIPTGPPLSAPVSSSVAVAVGRILATIHGLALPIDRISPWHRARLSDLPWSEVAASAASRNAGWAAAMTAAVPVLEELDTVGAESEPPHSILSHNNLTPGNARRSRAGDLIVVDWEHAGGQPPEWELADALKQWTLSGRSINVPAARAMYEGYADVAGSPPQLEIGSFRGAAISLSNYVFGQAWDALQARTEDDRRHTDRSITHLLSGPLPARETFAELIEVTRAGVGA